MVLLFAYFTQINFFNVGVLHGPTEEKYVHTYTYVHTWEVRVIYVSDIRGTYVGGTWVTYVGYTWVTYVGHTWALRLKI